MDNPAHSGFQADFFVVGALQRCVAYDKGRVRMNALNLPGSFNAIHHQYAQTGSAIIIV